MRNQKRGRSKREKFDNSRQEVRGVEPKFSTFKEMRSNFQPVTIYANPKDGPLKAGQVYPILAQSNKIIGTEYSGDRNYSGNYLRTMAARSETELTHIYDMMKFKTRTFLYLTKDLESPAEYQADTIRGNMIRSISSTLSQLFNETFRELDFFKLRVTG